MLFANPFKCYSSEASEMWKFKTVTPPTAAPFFKALKGREYSPKFTGKEAKAFDSARKCYSKTQQIPYFL